MGIRTDSPLASEARRGVMEFLLTSHPLDCPICDQAGECKLQEYSNDYGQVEGRFEEKKTKKGKSIFNKRKQGIYNQKSKLYSSRNNRWI